MTQTGPEQVQHGRCSSWVNTAVIVTSHEKFMRRYFCAVRMG